MSIPPPPPPPSSPTPGTTPAPQPQPQPGPAPWQQAPQQPQQGPQQQWQSQPPQQWQGQYQPQFAAPPAPPRPPRQPLRLDIPGLAWARGLLMALLLLIGSAVGAVLTSVPLLIALAKGRSAAPDAPVSDIHGWPLVMQLLGAGYPAGGMHYDVKVTDGDGATTGSFFLVPWLVLIIGLVFVKLFGRFVLPTARVVGWVPRLIVAFVSGLVFAGAFIILVATAPVEFGDDDASMKLATGSFWRAAVAFAIAGVVVFLMLLPRERGRIRAGLRAATSTVTEHAGSLAVIGAVVMLWYGLQRMGAWALGPVSNDAESSTNWVQSELTDLIPGTDLVDSVAKALPLIFLGALTWFGPTFGLNGVSLTHLIPSHLAGKIDLTEIYDGESDTEHWNLADSGATDSVSLVGHGVAWWVWLIAVVVALLWVLLAGLRSRVRRGTPNSSVLDAVWLPLVYAVAGVIITFAARIGLKVEGDSIDGSWTGSLHVGPAWWGIFVFLGVGVLVEAVSRLVAVPALKAAPSWIVALVSIGLGKHQPIAPTGPSMRQLRDTATKGGRRGWGIASLAVVVLLLLGLGSVGTAVALPRTVAGPDKEVAAYLDDLIDGKASAALQHYDKKTRQHMLGSSSASKTLLKDKVYSKVKKRPDGYKIGSARLLGDQAAVSARVHQDGKYHRVHFRLKRSGSLVPSWNLTSVMAHDEGYSMAASGLSVDAYDSDDIKLNGDELSIDEESADGVLVLPGEYTASSSTDEDSEVVGLGEAAYLELTSDEDEDDYGEDYDDEDEDDYWDEDEDYDDEDDYWDEDEDYDDEDDYWDDDEDDDYWDEDEDY